MVSRSFLPQSKLKYNIHLIQHFIYKQVVGNAQKPQKQSEESNPFEKFASVIDDRSSLKEIKDTDRKRANISHHAKPISESHLNPFEDDSQIEYDESKNPFAEENNPFSEYDKSLNPFE